MAKVRFNAISSTPNGLYALGDDGYIYELDTRSMVSEWSKLESPESFEFSKPELNMQYQTNTIEPWIGKDADNHDKALEAPAEEPKGSNPPDDCL